MLTVQPQAQACRRCLGLYMFARHAGSGGCSSTPECSSSGRTSPVADSDDEGDTGDWDHFPDKVYNFPVPGGMIACAAFVGAIPVAHMQY